MTILHTYLNPPGGGAKEEGEEAEAPKENPPGAGPGAGVCPTLVQTVSSLLQSVDSHGLWGGLTDGLPSTLGSARLRFERDRTSLRCPPYAALTSV